METLEEITKVSAGDIYAAIYLNREELRLARDPEAVQKLIDFAAKFNVRFKDHTQEMYFRAALNNFLYTTTYDMDELCRQCLDFTNIKQLKEPEVFKLRPSNRTPRCKCWRCS